MTKSPDARPLRAALLVIAAVLAVLPLFAHAQENPTPTVAPEAAPKPDAAPSQNAPRVNPDNWVTQVFQLKHARASELVTVLRMISGRAEFQRDLNVLMWSGPKELAPAVKDVVERLDVPTAAAPSIDLTFYMLSGSKHEAPSASLPSELEGVATQVKGIFGLTKLSLLESAVIRVRDGSGGRTEGVVPGLGDESHPANYQIDFGPAAATSDERGRVVSLTRLSLRLNVPFGDRSPAGTLSNVSYRESSLRTDATVREGQKVVVGKASVDRSGDTLFLVVTAKVVE